VGHAPGQFVVFVTFLDAGGTEYGHAGADEVEGAEATEEVAADCSERFQFLPASAGASDEASVWILDAVDFVLADFCRGDGAGFGEEVALRNTFRVRLRSRFSGSGGGLRCRRCGHLGDCLGLRCRRDSGR
jgi:hypothetical protein